MSFGNLIPNLKDNSDFKKNFKLIEPEILKKIDNKLFTQYYTIWKFLLYRKLLITKLWNMKYELGRILFKFMNAVCAVAM